MLGKVEHGHGESHLHLKMGGGFPTHHGAPGLSYAAGAEPRAIYKSTMRVARVRMYTCDHVPAQQGDARWPIAPGEICMCPFGAAQPVGPDGLQFQLTNCRSCQFYKWSNGLVLDNRL